MTLMILEFESVPEWIHVTAVAIHVGWLYLVSVLGFEPWNNLRIPILAQCNRPRAEIEQVHGSYILTVVKLLKQNVIILSRTDNEMQIQRRNMSVNGGGGVL